MNVANKVNPPKEDGKPVKQQCNMAFIYLSWGGYLGGLAYFVTQRNWSVAVSWLILVPLAQWGYIRIFPKVSRYLGYGRVDDKRTTSIEDGGAGVAAKIPAQVTFYSALGCPFCPLVKRRLLRLQAEMGFALQEVDVTLRPDLLLGKGLRAVPVVEAGGRHLVGHATTEQLADFIAGSDTEP